MADGTFAILMLVAGLADMGLNYCGTETGCVGRTETAPRVAISGGQVLERRAETGGEAYLRYDLGHRIGPFGQAVGLSIGDKGEGLGRLRPDLQAELRIDPVLCRAACDDRPLPGR